MNSASIMVCKHVICAIRDVLLSPAALVSGRFACCLCRFSVALCEQPQTRDGMSGDLPTGASALSETADSTGNKDSL